MRTSSKMVAASMCVLIFGCSQSDPSQLPQIDETEVASLRKSGELQRICQAWDQQSRAAAALETREGQTVIIAAVRANADPASEADKAAKANQWGLIRSYDMMASGSAFGVDCSETGGLSHEQPLVRAYRVFSDVPGSCETFGTKGDCTIESKLDAFAVSYNRALVARSDYPYRDICRISQSTVSDELATPYGQFSRDLGLDALAEPDRPRDFPEAVRRGNIQALERMLVNDREAVNRLDAYRMSPLQWAVRYGQGQAVDWLLRNGALPDGGHCGYLHASPFRAALRRGHEETAARIHAAIPASRRKPKWESEDMFAAAVGGSTTFLRRMLREPHEDVNRVTPRDGLRFDPAAAAVLAKFQSGS